MTTVLAVDFGASSIRVAAVDLDARPPAIEIVHRVADANQRAVDLARPITIHKQYHGWSGYHG